MVFLASQDALEVMRVSDWALAVLTDVTLVSDDTYGEDEEEKFLMMVQMSLNNFLMMVKTSLKNLASDKSQRS